MRKWLIIISLFIIIAGCSENEGDQSEKPNVSFSLRAVEVIEENLEVHVKGEVSTSNDTFYYKVEQGTETILEEQSIPLDEDREGWRAFEFEITLKQEHVENEEVPFITFYTKENNEIVSPNYVPIEIKDSQ